MGEIGPLQLQLYGTITYPSKMLAIQMRRQARLHIKEYSGGRKYQS